MPGSGNMDSLYPASFQAQRWTPERVYHFYRIFLTLMLAGFFLATREEPLFGQHAPGLFLSTVLGYLLLALIIPLLTQPDQGARRTLLMLATVCVDIIFLTLLVHASGGIASSLTVLFLVTVAAANILLPARLGLLSAALATLAVMFEQFYFSLGEMDAEPFQLTESGLLGLSFFAIALITGQLTRRLARSEALTARQSRAIAQLEALNRKVVERMRTGVLVFDEDNRVVLVNHSARALFERRPLVGERLPAPLIRAREEWERNPGRQRTAVAVSEQAPEQEVGFARLDTGEGAVTIAFLEDRSRLVQEAQQLKLASLGRLSATIAHEIRNPLSAINHAAELLDESEDPAEESRLRSIIRSHVTRVNGIIDEVLGLSRRPASAVRILGMGQVLELCRQCWQDAGHPPESLQLRGYEEQPIRFDPEQLRRILENLLDNAWTHGQGSDVEVDSGVHPHTGLPWLAVRDRGPGVSAEAREHLFEPFFTTSRNGTGLGLFLCRELCESNQARLDYRPAAPGSSFVITFAHPDRGFE